MMRMAAQRKRLLEHLCVMAPRQDWLAGASRGWHPVLLIACGAGDAEAARALQAETSFDYTPPTLRLVRASALMDLIPVHPLVAAALMTTHFGFLVILRSIFVYLTQAESVQMPIIRILPTHRRRLPPEERYPRGHGSIRGVRDSARQQYYRREGYASNVQIEFWSTHAQ